ncbi:hypothetical protein ACI3E1_01450 [Ligilactobacillus sp. LYQ139]|uniref:hypothetical protein n=1 Tax=Ligilactobacillus sp. LYQ139 TaxID=3378800 RepID=UPI003854C673
MGDERLRRRQHEEFDQEWDAAQGEQAEHFHRENPEWARQADEDEPLPTRKEHRFAEQQAINDEKTRRLGRKLNRVILVLVILIVLTYLFMRFVNF